MAGIDVFLHWSWFVVALLELQYRPLTDDPRWHVATYVTLFGIVLLHEFGHALACRSVGGRAERIVLWPLGGIAFVQPPPRPGAVLWSIAAGPLVNVLLVPVTIAMYHFIVGDTDQAHWTGLQSYVGMITGINLLLLAFNMLPIYPLDGGQVVQSILWFMVGRARSLKITAGFGLLCAAAAVVYALMRGDVWLVVLSLFVASQAWRGLVLSRYFAAQELLAAGQARTP